MKKLIVIILVLIGFSSIAQTPPRTGYLVQTAKWKFVNPIWLDSGAYITKIVKTSGQNRYLVYDSLTGKIGYRFVSTDLSGYVPYTGATTNVNIGANTYIGHSLKSDASDGVLLEAANGTDVGIFGAGNTANSSLYGGLTIGSITSGNGTDSVVVASSAGLLKKRPASAFGTTYTGGNGIIVGGSVIYRDSLKSTGQYGNSWQNGMYLGSSNNRSVRFRTNGTEQMVIDTFGRIGSGVSVPLAKMHIKNGSSGQTPYSTNGFVFESNASIYSSFLIPNTVEAGFLFGTPAAKDVGWILYTPNATLSNHTMGFRTGNVNAMTIKNGLVGIGGTPISTLTIPVAPTASANYGLVSLGSGAFDGVSGGNFAGSPSGNVFAINTAGGFGGDLLNLQVAGSCKMRLTSSAVLGFGGTTLSTWGSQSGIIEGGGASLFLGQSGDAWFSSNAYFNAGWKYKTSSVASNIGIYNGEVYLRAAPSGTTGNTITFTMPLKTTYYSGSGMVGLGGDITTTGASLSGATIIVTPTLAQFGGTTSSFPALKRSTTTIEVRLADDSGYGATQSLYDRFGSGSPESVVTAPIGAIYHRTDGGAGTSLYVKESGTGNTGWIAK